MPEFSRSVRRRIARHAPRWYAVPVVSPYEDRLRRAAVGDHTCRHWRIAP